MRKIVIDIDGTSREVLVPQNCKHPVLTKKPCPSIHSSNPECDCRWCVFNKEYCQANLPF